MFSQSELFACPGPNHQAGPAGGCQNDRITAACEITDRVDDNDRPLFGGGKLLDRRVEQTTG
jgi:hypothetical protein